MIDTILFDLDGTLLPFSQEEFVTVYFSKLTKVFVKLGLDAELAVKTLWSGTKAMMKNDGAKRNSERFWEIFSDLLQLNDERQKIVEAACDKFYTEDFDSVKSILNMPDPTLPRRMIDSLKARGFDVVLATNPLFPSCAVTTRLRWIELEPQDFRWITDYSNSSYCKPNPNYFRDILTRIDKKPTNCLMVGNNAREDMSAAALGMDVFLVTDCLENEADIDISALAHGSLAQLEAFLSSLLSVTG